MKIPMGFLQRPSPYIRAWCPVAPSAFVVERSFYGIVVGSWSFSVTCGTGVCVSRFQGMGSSDDIGVKSLHL